MSTLTIYSVPNCPQCDQTKLVLSRHGISFNEVDLSQDEKKREELRNKGVRSAPFVEFGSDWWSGFNMGKIKSAISAVQSLVN
ncbi:MAG: glutaredoxin family protein [Gammaproteobacteria bacterium]|nr:glutaredoxin family protein [Acholeplasmataceae bacterium]MCK9528947.1 glutaredoxin family protein [Gammaproteobacteria bacterium]